MNGLHKKPHMAGLDVDGACAHQAIETIEVQAQSMALPLLGEAKRVDEQIIGADDAIDVLEVGESLALQIGIVIDAMQG